MRLRFLAILFVSTLFVCIVPFSSHAKRFGAWRCIVHSDEMTGEKSYWVETSSLNTLDGAFDSGTIELSVHGSTILLYAHDMGFDGELTRGLNGFLRVQACRVKIDDAPVERFTFRLWEDTPDGMILMARPARLSRLLDNMKSGGKLYIEVKLGLSKGYHQVARFSLMGFTKALQWLEEHK